MLRPSVFILRLARTAVNRLSSPCKPPKSISGQFSLRASWPARAAFASWPSMTRTSSRQCVWRVGHEFARDVDSAFVVPRIRVAVQPVDIGVFQLLAAGGPPVPAICRCSSGVVMFAVNRPHTCCRNTAVRELHIESPVGGTEF